MQDKTKDQWAIQATGIHRRYEETMIDGHIDEIKFKDNFELRIQ